MGALTNHKGAVECTRSRQEEGVPEGTIVENALDKSVRESVLDNVV